MAARMVFLGAPGVGKGTFAQRLAPELKIPSISTGDLVRAEIKAQTPRGRELKRMNDSGALVPDEIVVDMARSRMEHEDAKQGFILDGFPRTIAQAEALAVITKLDVVVNISFPEDLLVLKAVSRRVCSGCGRIYNLASFERDGISLKPLLPKRDGVCDACSSPLVSRDDDKESVVRDRLRHYHKATAPLVDYYATRGLLLPFDVKKGVDDTPVLLDALRSFLRDRGTLLA